MDYNAGFGRGRGGGPGRGRGRGQFRDRSFSPPPQRRSPDYGRYGPGGGRGGGRGFGRRDGDGYRDDFRGRDGPDERGRGYNRDGYNRHGAYGRYGREGSRERDRDREYDGYGRGPPDSPGYEYDKRGSPAPEEPGKVLSKTMFIKRHIDEDLDDAEIDKRYTDYLASVYKSKNKAAFERQKNEDGFKRKFDPFMFKEEVEQRSKTAQTTAVTFAKNMSEGKYDWTAEGKQQLLLPSEFKKACSAKTPCPVISWLPEIIDVCWKVSSELIVKLDAEKGIARADTFDWIEPRAAPEAAERKEEGEGEAAPERPEGDDGGGGSAKEGGAEAEKEEDMMEEESGASGRRGAGAPPSEAELLAGEPLTGDILGARTGQLDTMLEYLWQVHGVDFYSGGGGELTVDLYRSVKERLMRSPPDVEFRAVRIQRPQSGSLVDDKRRDQVIEEFHHNVSKPWIERLKRVDADTQKALDLDAQLDAAVAIAVQKFFNKAQADSASGSFKCQFCDKKFKGELYLSKHTSNKHKEEFDAYKDDARNKAREELFFENFESHLKNEQEVGGPAEGGGGPPRGPMDGMGPRPMGPMGPMPPMPMMPPMMMNPMMMNMMAPQMGMMMQHMMMNSAPGRGMPPGGPPYGSRGGGGGRGMGGGRGSRGRGGHGREYFDFDAPANQREQLNYGDI